MYKRNKSEDNKLNTGLQRLTEKSHLCFFCCTLGGFSMGGGMAMHLAYRFHQDLAGVFALSSFLNKDSAVYQVSV